MSFWYVDSAASGSHDGTSWANAWTTLGAVVQSGLTAGDTVFVQGPATYSERLAISKSGTSASARITYKGINSPIVRGINGSTYNYIGVIGFHFFSGSDSYAYSAIYLAGASGWLIQDNLFEQTTGGFPAVDLHFQTSNTYNIIRGNTFTDIGLYGVTPVGGQCTVTYGDHNLIEYNTFNKGRDRCYNICKNTIIRNNHDTGTDETLFPGSNPYPDHIDDMQGGYSSASFYSTRTFIDRNFWSDNISSNSHNTLIQDSSGTGLCIGNVVRQNVAIRTGSGFATSWNGMYKSRIFNNTIAKAEQAAVSQFTTLINFGSPTSDDANILNNTFYATNCNAGNSSILLNSGITNYLADYNHIYANGVLAYGMHNLTSNPLFTDQANDDYTLTGSSPLKAAATSVTTANGAGTASMTLVVHDATGICDGFGITDGDWIKIGSNNYVQVSSVDYSTDTITLATATTWGDSDVVYIKGTEDIGALPYSFAVSFTVLNTTPLSLPSGSRMLSASVSNSDAVRFVQFLVDGIPVGEVYSSPYSMSWTSDGGNHVVTARAYNAWPSKTLWIQQDNSALSAFGGSGSATFTGSGSTAFA